MRINSLRAFLLASSHRSISRAAQEMHLTQPALSKIVQMLEADLGVELFHRTTQGLQLTPCGAAFMPYAQRILADLDAARRDLQAVSGHDGFTLRVGADSYLVGEILPTAIAQLVAASPELKVEITIGAADALVEATARGALDLCITSVANCSNLHLLSVQELLCADKTVVARAGHPLLRRPTIRLSDIVAFPWVHFGPSFATASDLVPILRSHHVELPRTIIEADSLAYVLAHLRNSDSLSFQPRQLLQVPDIIEIPVVDAKVAFPFRIVAAHTGARPPLLRARQLLVELGEILQKQVAVPHQADAELARPERVLA
jgi:DNA-binding transcriptional LysR family regulator